MQLATLKWPTDGTDNAEFPSVRTVVFRGFLGQEWVDGDQDKTADSNYLTFVTDSRSSKVQELLASGGKCEICWYFPQTWEQYRLTGRMRLILPPGPVDTSTEDLAPQFIAKTKRQQYREKLWDRMSLSTRQGFLGPPPGSLLAEGGSAGGERSDDGYNAFTCMVFESEHVDYLLLGKEQARESFHCNGHGEWTNQAVHP